MFMHRIKLKNILSFGPDEQDLELKPLNVLIGPNGSGKSNFLEVIGLLKAAPTDLAAPIREGGGSENWIWRGDQEWPETTAEVEVLVRQGFNFMEKQPLRYSIAFASLVFGIAYLNERIGEAGVSEQDGDGSEHYLERKSERVVVSYRDGSGERSWRELLVNQIGSDQSILSQLKDPSQYPEITALGIDLAAIRLYREWCFGRNTAPRLPQKADLQNYFLSEDGRNLGMVLNRLEGEPKAKRQLLSALQRLYEGIDDYHVTVNSGSVQVTLHEGNVPIPATRLSDGTLRYLCLLAILCDPNRPSLVCIEEPELGLHPDVLPDLADLLRETSQRCQLIVTTHSDALVDALTDTPESVVVCEKERGQTKLKRLDKDDLAHWLEKYRLGELWTSGELGGNRW